ncbi:type II toxin-antitoxin system PemK/MazF family toxin [Candidatus Methylospira mobilis]|uniref:type II toxin-antitoxin system PemK/MazF family toxin n=1 Tax=Candidatus Methylospira mobilis TaxID=1808979 RepID=UPI0028E3189C|nr:type II toxin-antitoxin system PemK/MazF family toxin [Candidatus Methylospira mobilis]WNV06498.1 type II toxin-antitoxin system PemK/MazF family toxin [Candidatus Methylospira mobilis]
MNRGDFVTIALQGDYGKPRPALIIQSDQFNAHATATVLLVSSTLIDAPLIRVTVQPDPANGLQKPSQVMVDKAMTVKRDKLGDVFGSASDEVMLEIERCLAVFLGIAK